MKRAWVAIGLLAGLTVTAGGGALAQEPIKIGAFGPMTGGAAGSGQSMREGIDLVVDEVNATGGVLGRKIQVLYGDDAGKPEQAVSIVKRFVAADNVLLVIGGISSPTSMAASQVTGEEKVPQIMVASTAARITLQGNPYIFRSAVPDVKLTADLADFIAEKFPRIKKMAAIYVNDDFGRGGVEGFKKASARHGIQIVVEEKYTRGDVDYTAQITKIRAVAPDAILDWSRYHEGALIAKGLKQAGVSIPVFGADGNAHPKYIELGGDSVNGYFYATHFSPATSSHLPVGRRLVEKMRAKYGKEADYTHSEAYDAALVVIDAIKRAGSLDREKIRAAMAATDLEGSRGRIRFDKNGDPTFVTHVVKVVNGKETDARK